MKYNQYPSYKDSGVEWLGKTPGHWQNTRLKFLGYSYGGLSGKAGKDFNQEENPNSKPFIPFTNIANSSYIEDNYFGLVVIDEDEQQNKAKKDDLFFLMSSEGYEDLGKSSLLNFNVKELYLNSFCKGFRIVDKGIIPKYLNYLLQGDEYRKLLYTQGNGFTRINLRLEKLNDLRMFIAPVEEQQAIANYLDIATVKIDTLIDKQTKLIELLKEKRQAVISTAVTRGLDSTVAMKDSGIEWLGKIPEGWEVKKFRHIFSFSKGLTITKADLLDKGIPCVNYGEIHSKYGFEVAAEKHPLKCVSESYLKTNKPSLLTKGDFIFADTSEDLDGAGNFTHLSGDIQVFAGYHTVIARQIMNNDYRYLAYLTDSSIFRTQMRLAVKGVKVFSVTQGILKDATVWIAPLDEQQAIARYLDDKTSKIDTLISKSTKAIELLKEKRTALISSAVTGKIDVREMV